MLSVLFLGLAGALQITNAPAISPEELPQDKSAAVQETYLGTETATPKFEPSSNCPALFGSQQTRVKNTKRREKRFMGVFQRRNGREVLHSVNGWQNISTLRMPYVQYRGTVLRDGKRKAHLSIKHPSCGNVRRDFLLAVDDSIGKHARVMAVMGDGILVEHGKALTQLSSDESKDDLRLIWRSPFFVSVSGATNTSGSPAKAQGAALPIKDPKFSDAAPSKVSDAIRRSQLTTSGLKKKTPVKPTPKKR